MSPMGVRDKEYGVVHCVHGKQIHHNVMYKGPLHVLDYDKTNKKGVMKDHELVKDKKKHENTFMLHYSRPCLCGSFLHRNTQSLDCLLNKRYLD